MTDHKINTDKCSTKPSFSSLALKEPLFNNLKTLGYESMTPIQAQSLPIMLAGHDIIAQAKTGSGKTAAFGLCLLNHLHPSLFAVQSLILCPTRELAEQVSQAQRQLARLMPNIKILNLSGGMPMKPQLDSLRHAAHIIVGTPGRVLKHLNQQSLMLNKLQTLILDEADRMLDMGFIDEMKAVMSFCPASRQTLLFSATFPTEIKALSSQFMKNPKRLVIEEEQTTLDIEQLFYEVPQATHKFPLLKTLLLHHQPSSALIFCNTKEQTARLAEELTLEGFSAMALNGDMEQADRDLAIIRFANQSCTLLIATDVAARGLDIKELPLVINYDLAFEHDVHIHRIGRTGRAGHKGLALNLTTPADGARLCLIENGLEKPLNFEDHHTLNPAHGAPPIPRMVTLCLNLGRKDKIRPGDVLGALTKDAGLEGSSIGKININQLYAYVAISKDQIDKAFRYFQHGKLKGLKVHARKL